MAEHTEEEGWYATRGFDRYRIVDRCADLSRQEAHNAVHPLNALEGIADVTCVPEFEDIGEELAQLLSAAVSHLPPDDQAEAMIAVGKWDDLLARAKGGAA